MPLSFVLCFATSSFLNIGKSLRMSIGVQCLSAANTSLRRLQNTAAPAEERRRNVLFNDALNTFYLRLYGVGHMVKDHLDSERGKHAAATWATLSD